MAEGPAHLTLAEIGLESYAPYLMNRIMGRYNASLCDEMADLGLTTPKMRALAVLSVTESPLIGELAVLTVVELSTLSRTLDQLQAEGLITRSIDPADSRATRVAITEAGRARFDMLWPQMAAAQARMFHGMPEEQKRAFVATLQKMLKDTRRHDISWPKAVSRSRSSISARARGMCSPARASWP